MDIMQSIFNWMDDDYDWSNEPEPSKPHGELVEIRSGAYGDWYKYEDGHEEYESIGD